MSPKYKKDPEIAALETAVKEARACLQQYKDYPQGHPDKVMQDFHARHAGYKNAGGQLAQDVSELETKLRHAEEAWKKRRATEAADPPHQGSLLEIKSVVSPDYTGIGNGTVTGYQIPGVTLKLGPVTPAVERPVEEAPKKPATPTPSQPSREAARQAATRQAATRQATRQAATRQATRQAATPAKTPARTPEKGSTAVLSRARQEAAAREILAEDTVIEAEHAVSEEMARMRQRENALAHAEGKERDAARGRAIAQERPLMEALRALVAAREDYQQASRAHRELIRHEEARAVLRARHRERLGRLRWWQKPGQRAAEHPVKALAWFTGLLGALVTAFATGAVSLFYDWVGGLLGIGG